MVKYIIIIIAFLTSLCLQSQTINTTKLDSLFRNKITSNGYSTCFYQNLMTSKILFEKDGYLSKLKDKYKDSYTDEIAELIINNNRPLLMDSMPSLYKQIQKATKRNDFIAINHRIAEFLAIYFDILFALNKVAHPGEKRLYHFASQLAIKPLCLEESIKNIFVYQNSDHSKLLDELKKLSKDLLHLCDKDVK